MQIQGTIKQWGNGKAVRLPKKYLDILGWQENDEIEMSLEGNGISIKLLSPKANSLDELFKGYKGNYKSTEIDFGEDVGREKEWQ